ncbi:hypothetical protein Hdeb2414_s0016g00492441 [Helianthus debilis subsp. tardiflorus]
MLLGVSFKLVRVQNSLSFKVSCVFSFVCKLIGSDPILHIFKFSTKIRLLLT